jgi:hypothetical protein
MNQFISLSSWTNLSSTLTMKKLRKSCLKTEESKPFPQKTISWTDSLYDFYFNIHLKPNEILIKSEKKSFIKGYLNILPIFDNVQPVHLFELLLSRWKKCQHLTCLGRLLYPVFKVDKNTQANLVDETPLLFYEPVIDQMNRLQRHYRGQ